MEVADPEAVLHQVVGEVLGHLLGERGDQGALAVLRPGADLVHQVVDLVPGLPHLDLRIHDPRGPDDLLDDPRRVGALEIPRSGRDHHHLRHDRQELVEGLGPVVERTRKPEPVLHERLLAGAVALVHAADLGNRLVRLVDEADEVVGEVVE